MVFKNIKHSYHFIINIKQLKYNQFFLPEKPLEFVLTTNKMMIIINKKRKGPLTKHFVLIKLKLSVENLNQVK